MVGIYAAVSTANHMAPWGGAEALLGTNPIAIGIPAGKEAPVVLDIATSVSSFGNIRQHQVTGQPMPEGWVVHSATGRADRRSEEGGGGRAAADRRPQGLRPRADHRACWPACSTARPSAATWSILSGPARNRPTPGSSCWRSTCRASCRRSCSPPRWTATSTSCALRARCRVSTPSACRARSEASAAPTAAATACRCRPAWSRSSTAWRPSSPSRRSAGAG